VEDVYRVLLRRAEEAVAEAERQQRRASELAAFVAALRDVEPAQLVRCAWCGRFSAGGRWTDPMPLIGGALVERLREQVSHGICPDCYARVSEDADVERGG
jgi:hypothetical protein